jgi:uncharacterized protein with GYD domain
MVKYQQRLSLKINKIMFFMIHILRSLSNGVGYSLVVCMLIGAVACQQGMQQETIAQDAVTKKDSEMKFYLTRFSYTPEAWARMVKNPEDRRIAATKYVESVGGKLNGFWYAFGEFDGYCLWQAPDNVSMAAVGFAISGGGALSKFETTVLLTVDETLSALRRAQSVGYRPPGTK